MDEATLAITHLGDISSRLWNELTKEESIDTATKEKVEASLDRFETASDMIINLKEMNSNSTSGLSGETVSHLLSCSEETLSLYLPLTDACFAGLFPQWQRLWRGVGPGSHSYSTGSTAE